MSTRFYEIWNLQTIYRLHRSYNVCCSKIGFHKTWDVGMKFKQNASVLFKFCPLVKPRTDVPELLMEMPKAANDESCCDVRVFKGFVTLCRLSWDAEDGECCRKTSVWRLIGWFCFVSYCLDKWLFFLNSTRLMAAAAMICPLPPCSLTHSLLFSNSACRLQLPNHPLSSPQDMNDSG